MNKIKNFNRTSDIAVEKSSLHFDENLEILRLLLVLQHELNSLSKECFRKFKLTFTQSWILKIVAKFPGLTLSRIAKVLEIPMGTLSNVLKKMCQKKLLEKVQDPGDARRAQFFLTDKGRQMISSFSMMRILNNTREMSNFCKDRQKEDLEYIRLITQRLREDSFGVKQ